MSKARGWQMPGPRAAQNLHMPHPGTDMVGKCPPVAREGGEAQVELTDALVFREWNFFFNNIFQEITYLLFCVCSFITLDQNTIVRL